jgi:glucose dehydrogenase
MRTRWKNARRSALISMPLTLLLTGLACGSARSAEPGDKPVDGARIADAEPGNWLTYGRTYDEQRFSPLARINDKNAQKLGLAWFADLDTNRAQEATPLIVDGVMYVSTAWSLVKAYDARTGRLLWAYDPQVHRELGVNACCDVGNRGVAAWNHKIFVGAYDGRLVALDAATGTPVWSTLTVDTRSPTCRCRACPVERRQSRRDVRQFAQCQPPAGFQTGRHRGAATPRTARIRHQSSAGANRGGLHCARRALVRSVLQCVPR